MTDKTQKQLIEEIHTTTTRLSTVLLGVPGTANGGLVQEVKDVKINLKDLGKSHGRLKRSFWILIGVIIGSGILGTGIWSLVNG